MRHKWQDNVCVKCHIKRKRKHWKRRMAITNFPPYDHYQHGCDMAYSNDDFKTWEFKAPECKPFCRICGLPGYYPGCTEQANCLNVSMEAELTMKRLGL